MNDAQLHRGPDGDGIKMFEHSPLMVGLGHRRLSIIDIEGGRQPMSNEDGTVWITYNGEIYNHRDLRRELEGHGHRFSTRSDTEAIVHAYEQWGHDCVHRLRGMFSFVIWDNNKRQLFAARDRLGIKPFYFSATNETLVCASEVKALLASGWIEPRLDVSSVPELLTFGYLVGDATLFGGVRKLLPGHWMTWREGDLQVRRYWDVPPPAPKMDRSEAEYVDEFLQIFRDAVRMRLMSDVPLGVFLSGGLDSSAIAATMAKEVAEPIKTFSVGYASDYYSEFNFAREVAQSIGADHHEVVMNPEDLFRRLPQLIWHEDAPVRTASSVALYHVAKLAGDHVKVVLTGEGSDELFAGYSRYWASIFNLKWGRIYEQMIPRMVRDDWVRESLWKWPLPASIKQKLSHTFLNHALRPEEIVFDNFISIFPKRAHDHLFTEETLCAVRDIDPYRDALELYHRRDANDPLDQLLYTDQKSYLVELLKKQDRMSMAASIESRVPFLDHKLVEFASRVPRHLKLRGHNEKYVVKQALQRILPESVLNREKMGFPVPIKQWLNEGFDRVVERVLLDKRTADRSIFRESRLVELLQENRNKSHDHTDALWTVLNVELWARIFIDGDGYESVTDEINAHIESRTATAVPVGSLS